MREEYHEDEQKQDGEPIGGGGVYLWLAIATICWMVGYLFYRAVAS